jgi:hypothetical protein
VAFPVLQVINDNAEAKAMMTESNLKSDKNQEIFLETEFDLSGTNNNNNSKDFQQQGRMTMYNKPSNNMDISFNSNVNANNSINIITGSPFESSSTSMSVEQELEETKRQIEEIKKSIQNYEQQNAVLDSQLNNYGKYSNLAQKKNKGNNIINYIKIFSFFS